MKKIYIKTLGCKVNTFDSHALEHQLKERGFSMVASAQEADISLLNSCSVTMKADQEGRYLIRRLKRENPDAKVVVTGCYAQTDGASIAALDDADLVIPNQVKESLSELLQRHFSGDESAFSGKLPTGVKPVANNRQTHFKSSTALFSSPDSSRTRAFLKVQDGCNGFCTYCLIPYARGQSRSVPLHDVLREAVKLEQAGVPEIVMAGIHLGDYGEDFAEPSSLTDLLQKLLDVTQNIRFRISSLEPNEVSRELLELMKENEERFCAHFHLPLQSGSDRILKLMRRTYHRQEYLDTVELIRSYFPECNIGADIIPGFPGETDEEHREGIELCERAKLNYLHVFPYARRPNTAADKMPNHLPPEVIKKRAQQLRELSEIWRSEFMNRYIGQTVDVLWEDDLDELGRRVGKTGNYLDIVATTAFKPNSGTYSAMVVKGMAGKRLLAQPKTSPLSPPPMSN